ncbi:MAG: hypothetical protein M3R15_25935 [Acidobacteriota bacterium]|nr:hypothetical protein [Acidobacteriota bacterium]
MRSSTKNGSDTRAQDLLEQLQQHPALHDRIAALLQVVENAQGDAVKADDAEERVAEELRRLGQAALQAWAERKNQRLAACYAARREWQRKEKKESGGTPASA